MSVQSQHTPKRSILGRVSSFQQPDVKRHQIIRDILELGRVLSTRGLLQSSGLVYDND